MLKTKLNEKERYGLTDFEILNAEKYLRKHKTRGVIGKSEAMKLYEMFLIGCSFTELSDQYPQYPFGKIVLTAAMNGWMSDRDKMFGSIKGRVQAKIVRSMVDSVDFLTTMIAVTNTEVLKDMQAYIANPNAPKPDLRIKTIKEYKDILETLQKLVAGSSPNTKHGGLSGLFAEAEDKNKKSREEIGRRANIMPAKDAAAIIAAEVEEEESEDDK